MKMKKISWLLIFAFFFSVSAFAEQQSFTSIIGSYKGKVFNGDNMDPVLTTFFTNDSGQTIGKYIIGEENNLTFGVLSKLKAEGHYTIVANWKDKYGSGILRMIFSSDYKAFYGFWGKLETNITLPWNGIK